jgi:hypothetical protein
LLPACITTTKFNVHQDVQELVYTSIIKAVDHGEQTNEIKIATPEKASVSLAAYLEEEGFSSWRNGAGLT